MSWTGRTRDEGSAAVAPGAAPCPGCGHRWRPWADHRAGAPLSALCRRADGGRGVSRRPPAGRRQLCAFPLCAVTCPVLSHAGSPKRSGQQRSRFRMAETVRIHPSVSRWSIGAFRHRRKRSPGSPPVELGQCNAARIGHQGKPADERTGSRPDFRNCSRTESTVESRRPGWPRR